MKLRNNILFVAIVASTIFSAGKASAHGHPAPPPHPVCPPSNHLPIDSNIVLLLIGGIVIGITAVKKANPAIKTA